MSPAFFNSGMIDIDTLFDEFEPYFPGKEYDIGKANNRNYVRLMYTCGISQQPLYRGNYSATQYHHN